MLFSWRQWLAALLAATTAHALLGLTVALLQPQTRNTGPATRSVSVSLAPLDASPAVAKPVPAPAETGTLAAPEATSPASIPAPEPASPQLSVASEQIPNATETRASETTALQPSMTESENVAPEAAGPVEGPETVEAVTVSPETATGRSAPSDADAQPQTPTPGKAAAQAQRRGSGTSRADEYVTRVRHWLARNKSYPERARRQNLEGVVRIRFAVDREGRVLDYRIVSSSGHALLDQEVEAMIKRAQPLPSMPEELRRTRMELIVPIHFNLHRR